MAAGAKMWLLEPRYGFQSAGVAPGAMFLNCSAGGKDSEPAYWPRRKGSRNLNAAP